MSQPHLFRAVLVLGLLIVEGCAATGPRSTPPAPAHALRILATGSSSSLTMDDLAARALAADVVFFGEEHTDPGTHHAELQLLEAIARRGGRIVLSLEMFERDVQRHLDAYLANTLPESAFVARSRPWARYATDYRALVELAKARGWPVVAANVPRSIASTVGRHGLATLDTLPSSDRAHAARDIVCPDDDYRRRFLDEMKAHSSGGAAPAASDTLPTAVAERFYLAQCVKDETMAESIVAATRRAGPGTAIVHFDGAFHSDFGAGTAARVRRRLPEARLLVITAVPAPDPSAAAIADPRRADVVVFTTAPSKPPTP